MKHVDNRTVTDVSPGEQLDHYRIERMVARGRGATTYRATDVLTNEPVAIEIPHPEIEADPVLLQRFQHEDAIGKSLEHPGLIKLIEIRGRERGRGQSYMVREWFEGLSLRELLSKGKLAPEQAIRIVVSIC